MVKRIISLFFVIIVVLSLSACGGNPFEKSKKTYAEINKAYTITRQMGADISDALKNCVYADEEILDEGASYLAKVLCLSEDEIIEGMVYTLVDTSYSEANDETKNEFRQMTGQFFEMVEEDLFTACAMAVSNAYRANGKVDEAQTALDNAKVMIQEMGKKPSDYEYFTDLKKYYEYTSSFFDFCQNLDCMIDEVTYTIDDYRNNAGKYRGDLSLIFE